MLSALRSLSRESLVIASTLFRFVSFEMPAQRGIERSRREVKITQTGTSDIVVLELRCESNCADGIPSLWSQASRNEDETRLSCSFFSSDL